MIYIIYMEDKIDFILVDDDPINNMLSELTITDVFPDAKIIAFTNPKEGLEFLLTPLVSSNGKKLILFLDLNMPIMSGWEFLAQFEMAEPGVKDQLQINILSSSVDPMDLEKAKQNAYVNDFIEKPLTEEVLISLVSR
ncbi:response regulator [Algoriphagus sp. A40]|uniref:response regulator n=1 Tax=Algoriphagus sp. A40 TaxID=1945863 RepID=UPI0009873476|nr:response regulator [Algoriphagus sp. A40]